MSKLEVKIIVFKCWSVNKYISSTLSIIKLELFVFN